jgi:hypothetical protein
MSDVRIKFQPGDLERLTAEAAQLLIPRTELIRRRALCKALSVAEYHRLVADAAAHLRNDLSRRHVEQLVAFVVTRLAGPARVEES